jgi:hypothetical protein
MEIEQGTPDCTGGTSTHENNLEIQICDSNLFEHCLWLTNGFDSQLRH